MGNFYADLAQVLNDLGFTPAPDIRGKVEAIAAKLVIATGDDELAARHARGQVDKLAANLRGANPRGELKFSSSVALARAIARVLIGYADEAARDLADARAAAAEEATAGLY